MQLQTILTNGDMVKIIVSKKVSPSLHWLSFSKTAKLEPLLEDIGKIDRTTIVKN